MNDPIRCAAALASRRGRVLLHSGGDHDGCGRWSFVACDPVRTLVASGREISVQDRLGAVVDRYAGDPLAALESLMSEQCAGYADDIAGPVPVAIGYIGYDIGRVIEGGSGRGAGGLERGAGGPRYVPDLWFGFYDAVWRHDRASGRSDVVGRDAGAQAALAALIAAGADQPGPPPVLGELGAADGESDAEYGRRVERILDYLLSGDVYQVNLARRLVAPVRAAGDPLALYAALHAAAPAPFGALLSVADAVAGSGPGPGMGWSHVISGSPERFLRRAPGSARLETRPIKGTRRRTGDVAQDRALARELARDDKERAEHLMIVDLERNDLGRIATTGSVMVEELGYVVELPTLYHMVSRVACELRGDVGVAEILRATFPGGSITGAPKIRAMQIIDELEPARRGPYTGAIGYLGLRGAMDLSIAIRTAILAADQLSLYVGGGIVVDSRPERELEETEEKAAGWRRALAAVR